MIKRKLLLLLLCSSISFTNFSQVKGLKVTETGNVGINISSPTEKLEILGNTKSNSYIISNQASNIVLPNNSIGLKANRLFFRDTTSDKEIAFKSDFMNIPEDNGNILNFVTRDANGNLKYSNGARELNNMFVNMTAAEKNTFLSNLNLNVSNPVKHHITFTSPYLVRGRVNRVIVQGTNLQLALGAVAKLIFTGKELNGTIVGNPSATSLIVDFDIPANENLEQVDLRILVNNIPNTGVAKLQVVNIPNYYDGNIEWNLATFENKISTKQIMSNDGFKLSIDSGVLPPVSDGNRVCSLMSDGILTGNFEIEFNLVYHHYGFNEGFRDFVGISQSSIHSINSNVEYGISKASANVNGALITLYTNNNLMYRGNIGTHKIIYTKIGDSLYIKHDGNGFLETYKLIDPDRPFRIHGIKSNSGANASFEVSFKITKFLN